MSFQVGQLVWAAWQDGNFYRAVVDAIPPATNTDVDALYTFTYPEFGEAARAPSWCLSARGNDISVVDQPLPDPELVPHVVMMAAAEAAEAVAAASLGSGDTATTGSTPAVTSAAPTTAEERAQERRELEAAGAYELLAAMGHGSATSRSQAGGSGDGADSVVGGAGLAADAGVVYDRAVRDFVQSERTYGRGLALVLDVFRSPLCAALAAEAPPPPSTTSSTNCDTSVSRGSISGISSALTSRSSTVGGGSSMNDSSAGVSRDTSNGGDIAVATATSTPTTSSVWTAEHCIWGVGDACEAVWPTDGALYPAHVRAVVSPPDPTATATSAYPPAFQCDVEYDGFGDDDRTLVNAVDVRGTPPDRAGVCYRVELSRPMGVVIHGTTVVEVLPLGSGARWNADAVRGRDTPIVIGARIRQMSDKNDVMVDVTDYTHDELVAFIECNTGNVVTLLLHVSPLVPSIIAAAAKSSSSSSTSITSGAATQKQVRKKSLIGTLFSSKKSRAADSRKHSVVSAGGGAHVDDGVAEGDEGGDDDGSGGASLAAIVDVDTLFGCVTDIAAVTTAFVDALTARLQEWDAAVAVGGDDHANPDVIAVAAARVGDVFVEHAPRLRLYGRYCAEHASGARLLDRLCRDGADGDDKNDGEEQWSPEAFAAATGWFRRWYEGASADTRLNGASLNGLMMSPIERVTRYKLLLKQLVKTMPNTHECFAELAAAQTCVLELNAHVDVQMQREQQRVAAATFTRTRLHGDAPTMALLGVGGGGGGVRGRRGSTVIGAAGRSSSSARRRHRRLLRTGELAKHDRQGRPRRYVFALFSDVLVYASGKYAGNGRLKVHGVLDVDDGCFSATELDTAAARQQQPNSFLIQSSSKSFVVDSASVDDKRAWLASLKEVVDDVAADATTADGGVGEAKTTTAAILQSIDAAVKCAVCSHAFSLVRRKHHCVSCGLVVCASCSKQRDAVRDTRKCDTCVSGSVASVAVADSVSPPAEDPKSDIARAIDAAFDASGTPAPSPPAAASAANPVKSSPSSPSMGEELSAVDDAIIRAAAAAAHATQAATDAGAANETTSVTLATSPDKAATVPPKVYIVDLSVCDSKGDDEVATATDDDEDAPPLPPRK